MHQSNFCRSGQRAHLIHNRATASSEFATDNFLTKDKVRQLFLTHSFIICPVLTQEADQGFIFVGTQDIDATITKGDREFISILANQIGQTLDNARLFEKTWSGKKNFNILKRFYKIYLNSFEGAAKMRADLMEVKDYGEVYSYFNLHLRDLMMSIVI